MRFNIILTVIVAISMLSGCRTKQTGMPVQGTWELISATTIEQDSSFSTFDAGHKMIKIINATHFAFLNHALDRAKNATTSFSAGGGTYTLVDSLYTENLEYFNDKEWENTKFQFVVKIIGDTLIQKGTEKVDKLGVDRVIIEKYKRVKS